MCIYIYRERERERDMYTFSGAVPLGLMLARIFALKQKHKRKQQQTITDKLTDGRTDRQTETDRQRERERERETDRQTYVRNTYVLRTYVRAYVRTCIHKSHKTHLNKTRFFALKLEFPDHYNQSQLLALREPLSPEQCSRAVTMLAQHHEMLRARYAGVGSDQVCQEVLPPGPGRAVAVSEATVPLSDLDDAIATVQGSLSLAEGRLLAAALLHVEGAGDRLLLVVHHIVVDLVSWGPLLEDLEACLRHAKQGGAESLRLPPRGVSFQHWARRLGQGPARPAAALAGGEVRRLLEPMLLAGGSAQVGGKRLHTRNHNSEIISGVRHVVHSDV